MPKSSFEISKSSEARSWGEHSLQCPRPHFSPFFVSLKRALCILLSFNLAVIYMMPIMPIISIPEAYAAAEVCSNGSDDDSDGTIDMEDTDCYTAGKIYYVSSAGNNGWNGRAPLWDGTNGPKQTLSAANTIANSLTPGDKLLFKRGDVWTMGTDSSYGLAIESAHGTQSNPAVIGAYGSGDQPEFRLSVTSAIINIRGTYDSNTATQWLRIGDLHISTPYAIDDIAPARPTGINIIETYRPANPHHIIISGVMVEKTGGGVSFYEENIILENSVIRNNKYNACTIVPTGGLSCAGHTQGLWGDSDANGLIVRNSDFYGNGHSMYDHNIYSHAPNSLIENNQLHDAGSCYIAHGTVDNITIRGNKIYNCGNGVAFNQGYYLSVGAERMSNITIENNAFYNAGGLYSGEEVMLGSCVDCTVKNNIFFNGSSGVYLGLNGPDAVWNGDYPNQNVLIANNTFNSGRIGLDTRGGTVMSTFYSKNNIFYSSIGSTIDANKNFTGNPSFLNSSNPLGSDGILGTDDDGFMLSSGSPAIDGGLTLIEVDTDIRGVLRPQGDFYDIGAYEHGDSTLAVCGDNLRQGSEVCDGTALGGQTCQSQGFTSGTLICNLTCDGFDTSTCIIQNQPPTINAGPDEVITLPINSVNLSGTVTDDGLPNPPAQVTVTWSKQSGPGTVTFSNQNQASTTATFSAAGTYLLRLSATDSELSSYDDVVVTVNSALVPQAPAITTPPISQTVNVGSSTTFNVVASGTAPLAYQWRKGSVDISGAINSSYTIANVQLSDAGNYDVVVSNGILPNATSNPATLTVTDNPQPQGLVLEMNFDQDPANGVSDSSGYGNNGTCSGSACPTRIQDKYEIANQAYAFDGVDDAISVNNSESLRIPNTITVSAWVKPAGSGWRTILSKGNSQDLYFVVSGFAGNTVGIQLSGVTSGVWYSNVAVPNAWTHIAFTYNGSEIIIYRDGQAIARKVYAGLMSINTAPLYIGKNASSQESFTGGIDKVKIFKGALSASAIQGLYNETPPVVVYTISASAGENGTITPSGSVSVKEGDGQPFAIQANSGYHIQDVLVDGASVGSVSNYTINNVTANHTISTSFAKDNTAPVANAQSVTTNEGTSKAITLTSNDVDGDPLTYAIVGQPIHGALSGTAPNVTYTPAANYTGADSFAFKVNDGKVDSSAATVSVTVTAVNDAPVVNAGADQTITLPINSVVLSGTATDDGLPNPPAAMTYTWSKQSGSGTVTFSNSDSLNPIVTFPVGDTYILRLTASDGALSGYDDVMIEVDDSEPPAGCALSSASWQNSDFASQTGTFTAEFDATPAAANIDLVIGLTKQTELGNSYNSYAALVVFGNTGVIEARNGHGYSAITPLSYTAGTAYHFRININPFAHTYSVWVTPAGGSEIQIAADYGFRTESGTGNPLPVSTLSSFDTWGMTDSTGSGGSSVCNFTVSGAPIATYTITASAGANGTITPSGSVSVKEGDDQPFAIQANATYHIADVLVDGVSQGAISTYTFNNVTANHTISANFAADPFLAPVINTQPVGGSVNEESNFDLTVSATGTGTLSYQWKKDGTNIVGATAAKYTITAAKSTDTGSYSVVVTNTVSGRTATSVTSTAAVVTIVLNPSPAPVINTQPIGGSVNEGSNYDLTVSATGSGTLSYQWKKDGTDISGATAANYPIASLKLSDAGSYAVVVTNTETGRTATSVISSAATLIVNPKPNIPPMAVLKATPNSGMVPISVTIDGSMSYDSDGSIMKYDFDFGDGQVSLNTTAIQVHVYETAGTFTATLTVTDNKSETSKASATVTVNPVVPPVFGISKFRLIDADKDVVVAAYDPLADGAKINKAIYPGLLNIEAITNPATVGSVKFELLSRTGLTTITRNTYPYTRWSYSKGNYSGSNLLGEYQLTATPYSGVNGTGEAGVPLTIRFAVEYENPRIEKFKLIDATLDQPASGYDPLVDGAILSLTSIPSYVNIEAITNPTRVGSVKLVLTKPSGIVMTVKRDLPLYTVWSRTGTDYKGVKLGKGKYVLSVTPYSQSSYQGVVGETKTIRFEVV